MDHHHTLLGGIVSFILKTSMFIYVIFQFKKLILFEETQMSSSNELLQLSKLPEVKLSETGMYPFIVLSKQTKDYAPLFLNDTLAEYIDINFKLLDANFEDSSIPDKEKKKFTSFPVRQCLEEDFGNSSQAKEYFLSWKGYSFLCPVFKDR
jgi:hypothetical protein